MTDLKGQIAQSAQVLRDMAGPTVLADQQIPLDIIRKAKGLCFITQVKAGFIFAGKVGGGLVIRKLPDGRWSAPTSIGTGGMSFGALVGAQKTDTLICLHDEMAVQTFAGNGQLRFGADLAVAAGPVGRDAQMDAQMGDGGFSGSFSYSRSQGLYGGASVEGAAVTARPQDNQAFYGKPVLIQELFDGTIPPPDDPESRAFYAVLDEIEKRK